MQKQNKVKVTVRLNAMSGKFQASIKPQTILSGKELIRRWAEFSRSNASVAKATLDMLEGFILNELGEGNRLDFGLVSFYPRLSGALSSRDADPETDDLFVRGAVKARRELVYGLKSSLEAENDLATVHSRIFNVFDKDVQRFDVLAAGHVLSVSGLDIPIDSARPDECVSLEKRTHEGYVRIAKARILNTSSIVIEAVFDEAIQRGKYVLAVYTRCGKGTDYKIVRCSRKVRAL